jgi:hypothetical protein
VVASQICRSVVATAQEFKVIFLFCFLPSLCQASFPILFGLFTGISVRVLHSIMLRLGGDSLLGFECTNLEFGF